MADTAVEGRASRPLSEISENEDRRRASARVSSYSSSLSLKGAAGAGAGSRPASEMRDDPAQPPSKRASGALASLPVHTITLNLADYTGTVASTMTATAPATPTTITPPVIATKPLALQSPSTIGSGAPSPTVKSPPPTPKSPPPAKPEKPAELSAPPIAIGASSSSEQQQQPAIVDLRYVSALSWSLCRRRRRRRLARTDTFFLQRTSRRHLTLVCGDPCIPPPNCLGKRPSARKAAIPTSDIVEHRYLV